jgi:hypothetical protein
VGVGDWGRRRRRGVVGFEDVEAFEFLIEDCQGLELLCLLHLRLEPVLDFILLLLDEILVVVVEMSMRVRRGSRGGVELGHVPVELQQCHLPGLAVEPY